MHDILQKIYLQKSVILVIRLLGTAESADPDNTIIEHSLSQVIWLFGYLVNFDLTHPSTLQEFSPSQVIWLFGYSVNFSPCSPSLKFRKTSPSQVIRLFGKFWSMLPLPPTPSQVIWLFGYSVNFSPCSPSLQLRESSPSQIIWFMLMQFWVKWGPTYTDSKTFRDLQA